MVNPVFEKNVKALGSRNPGMVPEVLRVGPGPRAYSRKPAKNGSMVPVFPDGTACNSLYDPEREAANIVNECAESGCVFFAGIGGGFHVREYLRRNPVARCFLGESDIATFRSLLETVDISDLISDPRVSVIPDCADAGIPSKIAATYLPSLHGNFRVLPLRPWQLKNGAAFAALAEHVKKGLALVSADFSVQAHFGRLWLRNIVRNLSLVAGGNGPLPVFDREKKAIVAAAGPGLEAAIPELRGRRDSFVIFSTDTAYGALMACGVTPDAFVSIDAQLVSAQHAMPGFDPSMTVIMDLCGNAEIGRVARSSGCRLVMTAGSHPLARYAASFSPLPDMDTSSGTVTVAALDAAHACGFRDVRAVGADFAYAGGKPYARGTYLEARFHSSSRRLEPAECLYDALMFRSPVRVRREAGRITYETDVLDRYAASYAAYRGRSPWTAPMLAGFPYERFVRYYLSALGAIERDPFANETTLMTVLPFVAWYGARKAGNDRASVLRDALSLASGLIAGYTDLS